MSNLEKRNSKIGKALINEATKQYDKKRQDEIVARVIKIKEYITQAQGIIRMNEIGINFFERQLHAIERGEFIFRRTYQTSFEREEIVFEDESLNKERAFS